ncbi:MAG TPA: putative baseplate assembly protein [Candidatus Limnocylindrales bacterium]|nr:putative baseplate assembly protein [Candidatus Limnocylindrales bacterium]
MTNSDPAALPAPQAPYNAPDTVPIAYRIGDFQSFRASLLDRLVAGDLLSDATNPFTGWRDRGGTDYATVFMELWAYVGDVLTFYQERVANEAFIQTATQRDSVLRLARLVEYAARPGAAANATVVFSAPAGTTVAVPAGFALATQPPAGQEPQTFETSAAITVDGDASAIALALAAPKPQFGPLGTGEVTRSIVLSGVSTELHAGDDVLVVQLAGTNAQKADLRRLISVAEDDTSQTTTIAWNEEPPVVYDDPLDVQIHALRISASPFGSTAPSWYALPPTLTQNTTEPYGPYANENWDDPSAPSTTNTWPFLPLPSSDSKSEKLLFLDDVYDVRPGMWLVLFGTSPSGDPIHDIFTVNDAHAAAVSAYAIAGKSTVVTLDRALDMNSGYRVRGTTVLTGSVWLALHDDVPLSPDVPADPDDAQDARTLILSGLHPELLAGRTIVVQGPDASKTVTSIVAETAVIAAPPALAGELTTIVLTAPLQHRYVRAQTNVLGNVTSATQGATVADEVLGSGDASAFQQYTLQESPLTYLASTGSEGLSALKSTLTVTVNGVAWREVRSLYDAAPDAQEYTIAQDANGRTTVSFGDGVSGSRPPTGVDNVHARYRWGMGTSGNVDAGVIAQLVGTAPGLEGVTNPLPAYGGADPETTEEVRAGAPVQASTFGRAVTARDVEALALAYPGVAKATASLRRLRGEDGVPLLQRSVYLTIAGPDPRPSSATAFASLSAALHAYLDARRDPRLPIQIADFVPVYVAFAVTIDVRDAYPRRVTIANVTAALAPGAGSTGFFAFEKRTFGETLSLGELYALVQGIPGVANARITRFACIPPDGKDPYPDAVRQELHAAARELFVVIDDLAHPEQGTVVVTYGGGGFADT